MKNVTESAPFVIHTSIQQNGLGSVTSVPLEMYNGALSVGQQHLVQHTFAQSVQGSKKTATAAQIFSIWDLAV